MTKVSLNCEGLNDYAEPAEIDQLRTIDMATELRCIGANYLLGPRDWPTHETLRCKPWGAWADRIATLERERDEANRRSHTYDAANTKLVEQRNAAHDLLRRIIKYATEDRAQTPGVTRLARALDEARRMLAPPTPAEPQCSHEGIGLPGCITCDPRTVDEGGPRPAEPQSFTVRGDPDNLNLRGTFVTPAEPKEGT